MKVGFDAKRAYHNYTGLGNYSRDLLEHLIKKGKEHSYFLYTPKLSKNPRLKFLENASNVRSVTPIKPINKTFRGLWRSVNLEKVLVQDGVELFHGLSNEIPRRKRNSSLKYVVTIHDLIFKRFPRNYKSIDRGIYNTKFKYACKHADKIIAISEQTKKDIIEFYNIPKDKIEVIYQTCHKNFLEEKTEKELSAIRSKFNLPEQFILNVGTIETRKNLILLIQSIPLMKNDLPIIVIGRKTKYFNFLKVQMEKLKIDPNRITFLKNVSMSDLPGIYQMADVFVYPSHFEGFGIPIIEALFSKTPVITSTGSCFSEAGGEHSIYVDSKDAEGLAQNIDLVLTDQNLASKMREEGIKHAQKFNAEKQASQVLELYKKVCS